MRQKCSPPLIPTGTMAIVVVVVMVVMVVVALRATGTQGGGHATAGALNEHASKCCVFVFCSHSHHLPSAAADSAADAAQAAAHLHTLPPPPSSSSPAAPLHQNTHTHSYINTADGIDRSRFYLYMAQRTGRVKHI